MRCYYSGRCDRRILVYTGSSPSSSWGSVDTRVDLLPNRVHTNTKYSLAHYTPALRCNTFASNASFGGVSANKVERTVAFAAACWPHVPGQNEPKQIRVCPFRFWAKGLSRFIKTNSTARELPMLPRLGVTSWGQTPHPGIATIRLGHVT